MFCISRHVFPGDFYDEITINNTKFSSSFTTPGAPRRTITTWDIISDLPAISSGKLVQLPSGILSQIYQIYLQVNWYYYHLGYYLRFTRYTFRLTGTITTWDIISDIPSGKLVQLPPGILSQIYQLYLQVNWYNYHLGYYLRFTSYIFR